MSKELKIQKHPSLLAQRKPLLSIHPWRRPGAFWDIWLHNSLLQWFVQREKVTWRQQWGDISRVLQSVHHHIYTPGWISWALEQTEDAVCWGIDEDFFKKGHRFRSAYQYLHQCNSLAFKEDILRILGSWKMWTSLVCVVPNPKADCQFGTRPAHNPFI